MNSPIPAAIRAHPFPTPALPDAAAATNGLVRVPVNPEGHAFIMRRIGEDMDYYKGLQSTL